jgi:hypothetical protein
MAIRDYLTMGSYSVIDQVFYVKDNRHVRFVLVIYKDETKQTVLATKEFSFDGHYEHRQVEDTITDELPQQLKEGGWYFITRQSSLFFDKHVFGKYTGVIDENDPNKGWEIWGISPDEICYYVPANSHCKIDLDGTMHNVSGEKSAAIAWWDSWFAPNIVFSTDTNLNQQLYSYLKTTDGFENTKDA